MDVKDVVAYTARDGKCPFENWLHQLKDKKAIAQILGRIDRVRLGNFGDYKSVGDGVFELRVHLSPGYRIYFGLIGSKLILLLVGGVKKTQKKDIDRAKIFLKDYQSDGNKEL